MYLSCITFLSTKRSHELGQGQGRAASDVVGAGCSAGHLCRHLVPQQPLPARHLHRWHKQVILQYYSSMSLDKGRAVLRVRTAHIKQCTYFSAPIPATAWTATLACNVRQTGTSAGRTPARTGALASMASHPTTAPAPTDSLVRNII